MAMSGAIPLILQTNPDWRTVYYANESLGYYRWLTFAFFASLSSYRRSSSSTSDGNRMVKEFRRPAAGKEVRCSELRPMPVIIDTVKYLLGDLLQEQIGKPDGELHFMLTHLNTPDIIRRTGNICLKGWKIGPSTARSDVEIVKMSYFDIVEQHTGIIHW